MEIVASIVTYNTECRIVTRCIESLLHSSIPVKIFVVDNSPKDKLKKGLQKYNIEYIFNNRNIGYGAANNIAIKRSIQNSKYHLALNPDVYFDGNVLENLYNYMEEQQDIGLIMPKVLYPDDSQQYLCKLLPKPSDLILRRFFQPLKIIERVNRNYEIRFSGYSHVMEVPYLSGCFMFMRTEALRKVGLFDERFFLYFEDTDLSRRIHKHYRTVFYPHVEIHHDYDKESYRNRKLLWIHIKSAVKYFSKWGWFFDRERKTINRKTIDDLGSS